MFFVTLKIRTILKLLGGGDIAKKEARSDSLEWCAETGISFS